MNDVFGTLSKLANNKGLTSDDFARTPLTATQVDKARPDKAKKAAGKHTDLADGGGLYLRISPTGGKVWLCRFNVAGKEKNLTIGKFPAISLAEARHAHRAARWVVSRYKMHPLEYCKEEAKRQQADAHTKTMLEFEAVVKQWTAAKSHNQPSTIEGRASRLRRHILPAFRGRSIAEIKKRELLEMLAEISKTLNVQKKPCIPTAKLCYQDLKQFFDYAIDMDFIDKNPMPPKNILKGQFDHKATGRKKLDIKELGKFLINLESASKKAKLTKAALHLVILTWCRTSEVTGARWHEFDLNGSAAWNVLPGVPAWRIPAARIKTKEDHTIYLSRQAVNLLVEVRRDISGSGDVVFPNRFDHSKPMNRGTLTRWCRENGYKAEAMDVHGFRSVGSTWANKLRKYWPDTIEVALTHKETDRIKARYDHSKDTSEFAEELRQLWQDWADFCDEEEQLARLRGQ